MLWMRIVVAVIFIIMVGYSFGTIGNLGVSGDNVAEAKSAVAGITTVNVIFTLILFGLAYMYITTDTTAERGYLLLITHASVFFSIMAVSISSIHLLDSAAASKKA